MNTPPARPTRTHARFLGEGRPRALGPCPRRCSHRRWDVCAGRGGRSRRPLGLSCRSMCRASAAPGPPASCHCRSPEGMCPVVKDPDCFTPMICHCKVACTNNTLSLMFGCKVGRGSCLSNACCLPGGANSSFCCLFTRLPVESVREARTCSALPGSLLGLGAA